jgi:hypothetical protein
VTTTTPAGWYPDPDGSGLRWWDGTTWTTHEHEPVPSHWLDDDAAASLSLHIVGRSQLENWRRDTSSLQAWYIWSNPDHMRTGIRTAIDGLRRVVASDERVVFLDDLYGYHFTGDHNTALTATVAVLTTRRAMAHRVRVVASTGFATLEQADAQPLAAIEIDRKRLLGDKGLHVRVKGANSFELSSKEASVIERVRAFVANPTPQPFPELAELLALPRFDPAAPMPGWYPDPTAGVANGLHRYWDGFQWTDETGVRGELVPPS